MDVFLHRKIRKKPSTQQIKSRELGEHHLQSRYKSSMVVIIQEALWATLQHGFWVRNPFEPKNSSSWIEVGSQVTSGSEKYWSLYTTEPPKAQRALDHHTGSSPIFSRSWQRAIRQSQDGTLKWWKLGIKQWCGPTSHAESTSHPDSKTTPKKCVNLHTLNICAYVYIYIYRCYSCNMHCVL